MASRFGFNVTIGADTNPFAKALKKLNEPIKEAQNELKKMNEGLKLDPTNINLITHAHQELKYQIDDTHKKIEALNGVLDQLDKTAKENNGATEEQLRLFGSVEAEIEIEQKKLEKLEKQWKNWGGVTIQQIARCWLTNGSPRWKD